MIDEKVLIERLEEKAIKTLGINRSQFAMDKGEYSSYCSLSLDDVKEITKDLASKHNNGWIPCEVRLPEEDGWYYTTEKCGEIVEAGMTKFVNGKWEHYDNTITTIAWKHRDAPYKKGE